LQLYNENYFMRKTIIKVLFRMSYSELSRRADTCVSLMTRDAVEMAKYGITEVTKTEIQNMRIAWDNLPSDTELKGDVGTAVEERDVVEDQVKVAVREIMLRAKLGFGLNSAKYRKFGTKGLNKMGADALNRCAERVVSVATLSLGELANQGLTQAMIDELNGFNNNFEAKIREKNAADKARDGATEERIKLGNALYKKVFDVFDVGKNYWVTRSEAKYNDYIMYDKKKVKVKTTAVKEKKAVVKKKKS